MSKATFPEWTNTLLGNEITLNMGQSPPSNTYNTERKGLPFFQGKADFGSKYPVASVWCDSPQKIAEKGSILFSVRAPVGEINLNTEKSCIGRGLAAITANRMSDIYLFYLLDFKKRDFQRLAQGSTFEAINGSELKEFEVSLPPIKEQQKIAEILTSVDEVIENTQSQINQLENLKKATMNELLTKGIGHTEFKETEIGRIPRSWQIFLVKDLFAVGRGRVISSQDLKLNPGVYPVFSSQSKDEGIFGYLNTYDFEGEHITWTTDGAYAGTVFYRSGKFNCTNVCGVLKALNPNTTHSRFLSYYLSSIAKKYVSYVGNPKLMNNIFSEIPVVLPPYDEQLEIDNFLFRLKKRIDFQQEMFAKLNSLKRSLMQDLLTGKVRVTVN